MAPKGDAPGTRGKEAEEQALHFLEAHGLTELARNYRCRQGEIDLVMAEGKAVVFVEVRLRRDARFGSAAESVNRGKQARVVTAAQHFLQQQPALARRPCRFDVVALDGATIEWIKNAFDLS